MLFYNDDITKTKGSYDYDTIQKEEMFVNPEHIIGFSGINIAPMHFFDEEVTNSIKKTLRTQGLKAQYHNQRFLVLEQYQIDIHLLSGKPVTFQTFNREYAHTVFKQLQKTSSSYVEIPHHIEDTEGHTGYHESRMGCLHIQKKYISSIMQKNTQNEDDYFNHHLMIQTSGHTIKVSFPNDRERKQIFEQVSNFLYTTEEFEP